jgi:hypothetical protein
MGGGRDTGTGHSERYSGGRKSERHMSVPVRGVRPVRRDQNQNHMHVNTNGGPVDDDDDDKD